MTTTVESVLPVVMAHQARRGSHDRLRKSLGIDTRFVSDQSTLGKGSPLRTSALAWAASGPQTHVLVVQDDVLVPHELLAEAHRTVSMFPTEAIAFYANSISWNGAHVALAHACGFDWVAASTSEYFPTLAVIMPTELARAFSQYAAARVDEGQRADDVALRAFLTDAGMRGLIAAPSRVQHDSGPSLTGTSSDIYRSAELMTTISAQSSAVLTLDDEFATFTQMRSRFYRRRDSGSGRIWAQVSRSKHLARIGTTWDHIRDIAEGARDTFPTPIVSDVRRASLTAYRREAVVMAITLGQLIARHSRSDLDPVLRKNAIVETAHAMIEASFGTHAARQRWATASPQLRDMAAAIIMDTADATAPVASPRTEGTTAND